MFIRTKTTPNSKKTAVQLVSNQRVDGKVKQKVIRHFGYALDEQEIQALKRIAEQYKLKLIEDKQPTLFGSKAMMDMLTSASGSQDNNEESSLLVDLKDIEEKARIKVGVHQVYGNLFDQIGLGRCIKNPSRKKAALRVMRDIVISRIDTPQSKRAQVRALRDDYAINHHLTSVYRMMDLLDDQAISKLKGIVGNHTQQLMASPLNVVFYDCTTLYFESFTSDELKDKGFSKDGKHKESQIVLALAVTQAGLPVDYEVFCGNTFEGHTLQKMLFNMKQKHQIDKAIFVADSALMSQDNCQFLREQQQDFILGARIKNMNKDITQKILDKSKYTPLSSHESSEQLSYRKITLKDGMTLLVTHSPKRARKNQHDREQMIKKLRKKYESAKSAKDLMSKRGYLKYLKLEGNSKVQLNEQKIENDKRWDGLRGIIVSDENMDVQTAVSQYHGLWQVEETFRISKHDMKMRPMFHWTPRRIKAHVAICYMALCCIRTVEYRIALQYKKLSPKEILYHISRIETSILVDKKTKKQYALPSKLTQEAKKIYQCLGLKTRETPYLLKNS